MQNGTAAVLPETSSYQPAPEPAKAATGVKYDAGKPDMSLISSVAITQLADVLTFGKKKYAANNWRKGMEWGRVISAVFRHLYAWLRGEDIDPESGLPHLAHAMCGLMFLIEYAETKKGKDDRYKGE